MQPVKWGRLWCLINRRYGICDDVNLYAYIYICLVPGCMLYKGCPDISSLVSSTPYAAPHLRIQPSKTSNNKNVSHLIFTRDVHEYMILTLWARLKHDHSSMANHAWQRSTRPKYTTTTGIWQHRAELIKYYSCLPGAVVAGNMLSLAFHEWLFMYCTYMICKTPKLLNQPHQYPCTLPAEVLVISYTGIIHTYIPGKLYILYLYTDGSSIYLVCMYKQ